MPRVTYLGQTHEVRSGQTLLEALLDGGAAIPYACRAGACGACIMAVTTGEVPAAAQQGMRETWRQRGYLYTCLCRPDGDLTIEPLGAGARVQARVVERLALSTKVARLRLRLDEPLPATAGQYVTLHREGVARSYSIAALPAPGVIELHVRNLPGGQLSPYLCERAEPGDALAVQGPLGDCVYLPGRPEQPLLLAGTGTGLAPLWGVLHDALAAGHRGPIHLFHGAADAAGLYLVEELSLLATHHPNLHYSTSALRCEGSPPGVEEGSLEKVIARHLPKTTGMRAFVCGDPALVALIKKKLFLSGTALRDLCSDAFLPAVIPATGAAAASVAESAAVGASAGSSW